ncbi:MAG: tetraacyldisaccharide 4'-kinase [Terriglobales bacterium]
MNPLTGIYGAVSGLRNNLFDYGVLRSYRLALPVVSVGNLSTGGSGKTPFVVALGEQLKARGLPFDVLSRGYRRQTHGIRVVDPDGSAADFGDEPLLISCKLKVPVIVGESRYRAGLLAEQKFDLQLHILDDGFQHRSLARDFDIVLMTGDEFTDRLLPLGRLREPLSSLARVDAVVLPSGQLADHQALRGKLVWRMKRQFALLDASPSPVVFCGIARPEQFFAQVRATGIAPAAEIVFRDHHSYGRRDIDRLQAMKEELGAGGFVTTEKDAVNLGRFEPELRPLALAALKVTLDNANEVVDTILARIGKRRLGS